MSTANDSGERLGGSPQSWVQHRRGTTPISGTETRSQHPASTTNRNVRITTTGLPSSSSSRALMRNVSNEHRSQASTSRNAGILSQGLFTTSQASGSGAASSSTANHQQQRNRSLGMSESSMREFASSLAQNGASSSSGHLMRHQANASSSVGAAASSSSRMNVGNMRTPENHPRALNGVEEVTPGYASSSTNNTALQLPENSRDTIMQDAQPTDSHPSDHEELERYRALCFIVARFLQGLDMTNAFETVTKELEKRGLLPQRIDSNGRPIKATFKENVARFPDVNDRHLGSLLDCLASVPSLPGQNPVPDLLGMKDPDGRQVKKMTQRRQAPRIMGSRRDFHPLRDSFEFEALGRTRWNHGTKPPRRTPTTFRQVTRLRGHMNETNCVTIDLASVRIITGSEDGNVKVWSLRTGWLIYSIRGPAPVTGFAISHDNFFLAVAATDGTARIYELATGKPIACLHQPDQFTPPPQDESQRPRRPPVIPPLTSVVFSTCDDPRLQILVATAADGDIRVWSFFRGPRACDNEAVARLSPEDQRVVAFRYQTTPWTAPVRTISKDRPVGIAFDQAGLRFAVGSSDGDIRVFAATSACSINEATKDLDLPMPTPQDMMKVDSGRAGLILNSDQRKPKLLAHLLGHNGHITAITFDLNGHRLLSGALDGKVKVWTPDSSSNAWIPKTFVLGGDDASLLVDDEERSYLMGQYEAKCQQRDRQAAEERLRRATRPPANNTPQRNGLPGQNGQPGVTPRQRKKRALPIRVTTVTWTCDSRHFLAMGDDAIIRVWDMRNGGYLCRTMCARKELQHPEEIIVLDGHPTNPNIVMSAGYDGLVCLWDIRTGQAVFREEVNLRITDGEFDQSGLTFVLGDSDGGVTVFNAEAHVMPAEPVQFVAGDDRALSVDQHGFCIQLDLNGNPIEPSREPEPIGTEPPITVLYPQSKQLEAQKGLDLPVWPNHWERQTQIKLLRQERLEAIPDFLRQVNCHPSIAKHEEVLRKRKSPQFFADRDFEPEKPAAATQPDDLNFFLENFRTGGRAWEEALRAEQRANAEALVEAGRLIGPLPPDLENATRERRNRAQFHGRWQLLAEAAADDTDDEDYSDGGQRPSAHSTRSSRSRPSNGHRRLLRRPSNVSSPDPEDTSDESYRDSADENELDSSEIEELARNAREAGSAESSSDEGDRNRDFALERASARHALRSVRSNERTSSRNTRMSRLRRIANGTSRTRRPDGRFPRTDSFNNGNRSPPALRMTRSHVPPAVPLSREETRAILPSQWISLTTPTSATYFPQIGDEVVYLRDGHVSHTARLNADDPSFEQLTADLPYAEYPQIAPAVFGVCKDITFLKGPPAYCKIRIKLESPIPGTNKTIMSITYRGGSGVDDFIILKSLFERSMRQDLQPNASVMATVGSATWEAVVEKAPARTGSPWKSLEVRLATEPIPVMVSPWQVHPRGQPPAIPDALPDEDTDRFVSVLEEAMSSEDAEHFKVPVDVNIYPTYYSVIPYPLTLTMILERARNKWYRRKEALMWDLERLKNNAFTFNEDGSYISNQAENLVRTIDRMLTEAEQVYALHGARPRLPHRLRSKRTLFSEESDEDEEEDDADSDTVFMQSNFSRDHRRRRHALNSDDDERGRGAPSFAAESPSARQARRSIGGKTGPPVSSPPTRRSTRKRTRIVSSDNEESDEEPVQRKRPRRRASARQTRGVKMDISEDDYEPSSEQSDQEDSETDLPDWGVHIQSSTRRASSGCTELPSPPSGDDEPVHGIRVTRQTNGTNSLARMRATVRPPSPPRATSKKKAHQRLRIESDSD